MMLAMRLLSAARGEGSEEVDSRTAESVLIAAAKLIGEPSMPAVPRQLEANGVKWAWQMIHFSDADWDRLGVSLGLKTAAKAELAEPSTSAAAAPKSATHLEELSDRKRRFLLLPDAEGSEAKPLGEISALFLALLTTPESDRQSLLLALCELMALVSGLFLSTPLDLQGPSSRISTSSNIWLVLPTLDDGMNALVAFMFLINFHVAMFAVVMAIYVAASGHQADDSFCEAVMSVLGACFLFFFIGFIFPLIALTFWQFFHNATSPYLMFINILVFLLFHKVVGGGCQRFIAGCLALELYHAPRWFLRLLRSAAHGMGTTHLLTDQALKAAAERRAAKLRAQMDVDSGASTSTPSSPAASAEARTRRHLRVIAME